jgi:Co/Zn/Cd efflux system component
MNRFGLIALIVNIAAAWVLSKHREGDANVRAVWLFSRNDAIGNVAVIIAAGLVWFTESAWPDLIVAFGIAGLFLHSSFDTVRDARRELQEDSPAPVQ